MKVMLDTFGMDRPTNTYLKKLGSKLNFYKGLPEMFEEFRDHLLTEEQIAHGITVEHYIISSGLKVLLDGSQCSLTCAPFSDANSPRTKKAGSRVPSVLSAIRRRHSSYFELTRACSTCPRMSTTTWTRRFDDPLLQHDLHRRRADRCPLLHCDEEERRASDRRLRS